MSGGVPDTFEVAGKCDVRKMVNYKMNDGADADPVMDVVTIAR